jgi:hypothetical protein
MLPSLKIHNANDMALAFTPPPVGAIIQSVSLLPPPKKRKYCISNSYSVSSTTLIDSLDLRFIYLPKNIG